MLTEGHRDLGAPCQALQEWPKPGGTNPARVRASRRRRHHAQRGREADNRARPAEIAAGATNYSGAARRGVSPDPRRASRSSRFLMHYLLDTNIVSDVVRNPRGRVAEHIARVGEAQVCTSIIVAAELRCGATKRGSPRLARQLEAVLGALNVLP